LNERTFLRDCLDSLVAQDYEGVVELLVLDGGSTDGTVELCDAVAGPIRVVRNHRVTAAAALNTGIAEAKGEVIVRVDAHALYAPDYVRRCVEVLLETNADNVGGRMQPVGTTSFGRAVAAVTSSPLGVGPGRFHYGEQRDEVDTVYLGCWWRRTLEQLGGFDETRLQWGAEDHELNFRLRSRGGRIVLDPTIVSHYFPRETPRQLARQYFNYGVGKASTLTKHRSLPTWRPFAPAALVLATVTGVVLGRGWMRIAVPAAHAAACGAGALRLSDDPGVAPHRAFAALTICHWAYGAGFWAGMTRSLRGREFDARPRGPR
jgi:GT2 family glycosyltransferase